MPGSTSFTITDQEFLESKQSQEAVYRDEGHRQADRTYVDPLGHARWDTDYFTLRAGGYAHAAALQEVRCRIREAWTPPLPAAEPHPPVPVAPQPPQPQPPQPPVNGPGVKDDAERFCSFYLQRGRETGFKPDHTTSHEQQMLFLRDTLLLFEQVESARVFVMKRASDTRPISNEVIVSIVPGVDYRRYWDFIQNAGTPHWVVQAAGPGTYLPTEQPLVNPSTLEIMPG